MSPVSEPVTSQTVRIKFPLIDFYCLEVSYAGDTPFYAELKMPNGTTLGNYTPRPSANGNWVYGKDSKIYGMGPIVPANVFQAANQKLFKLLPTAIKVLYDK